MRQQTALSHCMVFECVMSTGKIIAGADRLFVDAPVSWSKHLTFDPLSSDKVNKTSQLLCLGLGLEADEHRQDLSIWKEW